MLPPKGTEVFLSKNMPDRQRPLSDKELLALTESEESKVAFGPYRELKPEDKVDPEDIVQVTKLIPIRKYGKSED